MTREAFYAALRRRGSGVFSVGPANQAWQAHLALLHQEPRQVICRENVPMVDKPIVNKP